MIPTIANFLPLSLHFFALLIPIIDRMMLIIPENGKKNNNDITKPKTAS